MTMMGWILAKCESWYRQERWGALCVTAGHLSSPKYSQLTYIYPPTLLESSEGKIPKRAVQFIDVINYIKSIVVELDQCDCGS